MNYNITLIKYTDEILNSFKKQNRERLYQNYLSFKKKFKEFSNGKDVRICDINADMAERFSDYIRYNNGSTKNTQSFYCRIFRAIYNRAVNADMVKDKKPFRRVFTGNEKTVHRALNLSDFRKFYQYEPQSDKEEKAKDLFMLSFYLRGMAPVDLIGLKKENLKGNTIEYKRRKTGQLLIVGVDPKAREILKKYARENRDELLSKAIQSTPKSTMQRTNVYLKQISKKLNLSIPVTMYVARHSWASIARDSRIDIPIISQALGHDNVETTRIYLSSISTDVLNKANRKVIDSITRT